MTMLAAASVWLTAPHGPSIPNSLAGTGDRVAVTRATIPKLHPIKPSVRPLLAKPADASAGNARIEG